MVFANHLNPFQIESTHSTKIQKSKFVGLNEENVKQVLSDGRVEENIGETEDPLFIGLDNAISEDPYPFEELKQASIFTCLISIVFANLRPFSWDNRWGEKKLGEAELAEVDGPFVKIRLRGKFWHKRSRVLARLGNLSAAEDTCKSWL
ncbi:hypothetical protein RJ641_015181 [Dillenia turbinata]|uniref:Uncharacterized protein n=1 Tax=Dillenia turbinata TaxID=194707 RepID=A0AAN8Z007_9MAGN